ncbi:hypothetical protein QP185_01180 [Sphingomonas aerolata]|uniref:hypothetical protein n=1 Tax=Sphingomonas aerolata TaxID=185951 RepID=UPI002FE2CA0C
MKTSQPITGVRARPKTAAPSGGKALISDHRFGILAVTLVVSASLYNAMLAIISAHVKGLDVRGADRDGGAAARRRDGAGAAQAPS